MQILSARQTDKQTDNDDYISSLAEVIKDSDNITPVLQQLLLHWLPVRQRVESKLAVLVYKAFNNLQGTTVSVR